MIQAQSGFSSARKCPSPRFGTSTFASSRLPSLQLLLSESNILGTPEDDNCVKALDPSAASLRFSPVLQSAGIPLLAPAKTPSGSRISGLAEDRYRETSVCNDNTLDPVRVGTNNQADRPTPIMYSVIFRRPRWSRSKRASRRYSCCGTTGQANVIRRDATVLCPKSLDQMAIE